MQVSGSPKGPIVLNPHFHVKHPQEMYLFANEGENHTNNVKQLEEMKKGTEERK